MPLSSLSAVPWSLVPTPVIGATTRLAAIRPTSYEGDEYTNWLDSIAHDAAAAEERSRVGAVRWATRRANAARRTEGD